MRPSPLTPVLIEVLVKFFLPFLTLGRFVTHHAAASHLNRALIRILYAQNPVKRTVSVQPEEVSGWAEKGGYDPVNMGFSPGIRRGVVLSFVDHVGHGVCEFRIGAKHAQTVGRLNGPAPFRYAQCLKFQFKNTRFINNF